MRPARSLPGMLCFDIFSAPPGDSDVTIQRDRLSSNGTKSRAKISADRGWRDDCGGRLVHGCLLCRWVYQQPHTDRAPVAVHRPWNLDRASDPACDELRSSGQRRPTLFSDPLHLREPQGRGRRSAPHLRSPGGGRGRLPAGRIRGESVRDIPVHRPDLAPGMDRGHPVHCLRCRAPENHASDQCRGIAEPDTREDAEDQGLLADRGGRHDADAPCHPQLRDGRPRCPGMGCGPRSAGHDARRLAA